MSISSLKFPDDRSLRVLSIGAHCDDIEIGCGGTLLEIANAHPSAEFVWVVLTGDRERHREARASAADFLGEDSSIDLQLFDFRDGYLPYDASNVKTAFDALKTRNEPDIVFTHYERDRHQDHRLVAELTWSTFRAHTILEYEIPKYDGDLGTPNCFVPLSESVAQRKVDHILRQFESQIDKSWFDRQTFEALMALRGMECPSRARYAEAFYCRKMMLSF